MKKILEFGYELSWRIIGKEDMQYFEMPYQRKTRPKQVKSLLTGLINGKHFDVPIAVRRHPGLKKLIVLEGGHRVLALREFFELFPDRKIKICLAIYPEEVDAFDIFTRWNSGVKESIDDFIEHYKHNISIYKDIIDEMPIDVYGSKSKLRFRHLILAYLNSKQPVFQGYEIITNDKKKNLIETISKMNYDDVRSMKSTFDILMDVFNPDNFDDFTRLPAFKFHIFCALYHLVAKNKVSLGKNYVVKRMKTVLSHSVELSTFKNNSTLGSLDVYNRCKFLLNKGVDHKFV